MIGIDPETLDPKEWGVSAEHNLEVARLIAVGEAALREAGYVVDMLLLALDVPPDEVLIPRLKAGRWDCVVIGGGIRTPTTLLLFFERVVNAVHRHAPGAAIAFNARPDDILPAIQRWIGIR